MHTLTVWIYDTPLGAGAGHRRLTRLVMRDALQVLDAVSVAWMPGAHQPRVGHRHGAIVDGHPPVLSQLIELLGAAPEAGSSAHPPPKVDAATVTQQLQRAGIEPSFIEELRARLLPGTSALWVLATEIDLDAVVPVIEHALSRGDVCLLRADVVGEGPDSLHAVVEELWSSPSRLDSGGKL